MTDHDHLAQVITDSLPERDEEALQRAQDHYERSIGWGVD